jgi:hypothetical protein
MAVFRLSVTNNGSSATPVGVGWSVSRWKDLEPSGHAMLVARGSAIQHVKAVSIGIHQLSHTTSFREPDAYPCSDQQLG